jgi:hypothetical protein
MILSQNVLQKGTGSARRLALQRLNGLYGLASGAPIGRALARLWQRDDRVGRCLRYSALSLANHLFEIPQQRSWMPSPVLT